MPATVTFAPGQSVATFPITVIDDSAIDGAQTTVIGASVAGGTAVTASLVVNDNETKVLTLSAYSVTEGANPSFQELFLLVGDRPGILQ